MKTRLIALALLIGFHGSSRAQEDAAEVGPGLITLELATGHFLNPTAGQQPKDGFSPQYCGLILDSGETYSFWQGFLAVYGLTDWLEVGAHGLIQSPDPGSQSESFGPQFRLRLWKGRGLSPQVAVGGVFLFDDVERQTVYGALSKTFRFPEDLKVVRSVGVNAGLRQFWLEDGVDGDVDDLVGFAGLELELPRHVYVVGETSTEPEAALHQPYSLGLQVRHPDGFGFSLAYLQPGGAEGTSVLIGVGINFY